MVVKPCASCGKWNRVETFLQRCFNCGRFLCGSESTDSAERIEKIIASSPPEETWPNPMHRQRALQTFAKPATNAEVLLQIQPAPQTASPVESQEAFGEALNKWLVAEIISTVLFLIGAFLLLSSLFR